MDANSGPEAPGNAGIFDLRSEAPRRLRADLAAALAALGRDVAMLPEAQLAPTVLQLTALAATVQATLRPAIDLSRPATSSPAICRAT
jgi:hypothetical protein